MSAPVLSCLAKPGAILLVSTYELGHQPLSLAAPLAHLARAGFAPAAADTAVEALDDAAIRRARLVAVAVPMHTALRLSAQVVERVRTQNPDAVIALYGLYAWLNGDHLLHAGADAVIAGDAEAPLVALARALEDHGAGWCAAAPRQRAGACARPAAAPRTSLRHGPPALAPAPPAAPRRRRRSPRRPLRAAGGRR